MKQRLVLALAVIVTTGVICLSTPARAESNSCSSTDVLCYQPSANLLIGKINTVTEPPIAVPAWLGGP
jgi:hypothetical protein